MNSKEQKNAKYNRHSYSQILNADNSIFLDLEIQDPLKSKLLIISQFFYRLKYFYFK